MTEYWGRSESIAEMHLFEALSSLANLDKNALADLRNFIDNLDKVGVDKIKSLYMKLRNDKQQVEDIKALVMEYLVRLGEGLNMKDLYASIALGLDRIVQLIDGASYRLYMYIANGYSLNDDLYGDLKNFIETLIHEYNSFYQGLDKLRVDPRRTIKEMEQVIKLEEDLDRLYRSYELRMFKKLADNVPALMLLKDAIDFIESIADVIKESAETLRYLALHRAMLA